MENSPRIENIFRRLLARDEPAAEYTISELVAVYNLAVVDLERPKDVIKSFRDHPTAVRRVEGVLLEIRSEPPGRARLANDPAAEPLRQAVVADQAAALASAAEDHASTAPAPELRADGYPVVPTPRNRGQFRGDQTITVIAPRNPKRGAAAERFAKYRTGMTVDEYAAALGDRTAANRELKWDTAHGYVKVK